MDNRRRGLGSMSVYSMRQGERGTEGERQEGFICSITSLTYIQRAKDKIDSSSLEGEPN